MVSQSMHDSTISGVDTNKNGLRDDLDSLVNVVTQDGNLRGALSDTLSLYQSLMVSPPETPFDTEDAFAMVSDALSCYVGLSGGFGEQAKYISEVIDIGLQNTPEREKAYAELNSRFVNITHEPTTDVDMNCLRAAEGANYQRTRIAQNLEQKTLIVKAKPIINSIASEQTDVERTTLVTRHHDLTVAQRHIADYENHGDVKTESELTEWQWAEGPVGATTYIENERLKEK